MWRELREDVEDELARLSKSIDESREHVLRLLAEHAAADEPDSWERGAAAMVVHQCYTGMENVLKRIAKRVDGRLPSGDGWHAALLEQARNPTDRRPAVVDGPLHGRLKDTLGFRHVARVLYGFDLDWPRLRVHLEGLEQLVTDFSGQARAFLDELERRSGSSG